MLGIVNQAVRKIADVIAAFEPLQASFVDCTGKATALASDVGRAGLNAQVFAIHAPDGATLEVLAGRMRAVSAEVLQQVEQMGAALSHTGAMVNNLRHRLEDFQILGQAEQELLNVESVLSQNRLSDLEGAIPVLLRNITQQQETFAQSVEVVLANVRFPATVAEASSRSMSFFRELVAWASEGRESVVVEAAASEQIHLLQTKYTMESERLAHAAALQPLPASGNATASQASIELFGDLESTRSPAAADLLLEPNPSNQTREIPAGPTGTGRRLESAQALASEPPAASEGLGDTVELF